ncbi:MAG: hypothetical protein DRQ55_08200 [Planctomycetota bacterium]|nr:MAG: hypothetical protein DRQ55_08200 [Planctomycetota bacterium]
MSALLALLLCLAQAALCLTQAAPSVAYELPPTRMGQELLSLRPLVAEVRTLSVTSFGIGTAVVRMRVERRLSHEGPEAGAELVVFAYDGHFLPRGRDLVHLLPFRRGGRWRVVQLVDGRDRNYRAKLAATRANLALMTIEDDARRAAAAMLMVLDFLSAPDRWTRDYALGELHFLAVTRKDLFTPVVRQRLNAVVTASPDDALRRGVELVTGIADSVPTPVPSAEPEAPTPP